MNTEEMKQGFIPENQRMVRTVNLSATALPELLRVAAYARVSSGKDAMLHSLSAQVSYYSELIQKHRDWRYVGVYADEAATGTKDSRTEFQRLLADCRAGKIDLILTKSISRFARNTVTILETVRELKTLGVDVFFQRENIHSMSGDGELLLTVLSSFAQEESLSVSENCKWRIRKQFSAGIPGSTTILGYKLIKGTFQIIPKEAEVVRMVFADYLSGMGKNAIVKKLIAMGVKCKRGGTWSESSIDRILRNEKYMGDMLLQKTFIADHIKKKKCINLGQLPMYYVEDSHEAIIDKATFTKVQEEIAKRSAAHKHTKPELARYPFTGKLICAGCGKNYKRKIANAGGKYEKAVWVCPTFNSYGKAACPSQQIPESILQEVSAQVLELNNFDAAVFESKVNFVTVLPQQRLSFHLASGRIVNTQWQHKSRRESWDDAAKVQARAKQLAYLERRNSQ